MMGIQHTWIVLFFSVIVVVAASGDVCLVCSTNNDQSIHTQVKECVTDPGVEVIQADKYVYFMVTSYNTTNTKDWVSGVYTFSHHVVYSTPVALVVAVAKEYESNFVSHLPSGVNIILISPHAEVSADSAKLESLRQLAEKVAAQLAPDPFIQSLVNRVSSTDLRNFVEYLSGEQTGSPIMTRNSLSTDAVVASEWLVKQFTSFGFRTTLQCFRDGYSCNVIATKVGSKLPNEVVIVGAHYDSRAASSTNPTQRAPGANDDGSGTGTLLQIAKIISQSGASFSRTIRLTAFSGEEQGLLGSQAYAQALYANKTNVYAMIQNDMIAYRATGTGLLCGFPNSYTTPALTQLAIATANLYSPTLTTGRNDRCCSDHKSFYELGFPATDFSDTLGPIVDPQYHAAGDLVNRPGFDFEKYSAIVKGILATAAVLAEPV